MDQPSFLHPDNHLHKVDVLSCLGGERMGRPKKQRLFAYSWQGMVDVFTSRVGKEWAGPVFLHPDNHLHKVDAFTFQGGERMGRPNFSPPQ